MLNIEGCSKVAQKLLFSKQYTARLATQNATLCSRLQIHIPSKLTSACAQRKKRIPLKLTGYEFSMSRAVYTIVGRHWGNLYKIVNATMVAFMEYYDGIVKKSNY